MAKEYSHSNKIIINIALMLSLFFLNQIAAAEEINVWVDKKGVTNITNRPPENPAKVIGKEAYTRPSSEEIENFERQRKAAHLRNTRSRPHYTPNTHVGSYDEDNTPRKYNASRESKEMREKRAQDRQEIHDIDKARLRALENKDYREARRQRFKKERIQAEQEAENE